MNVASDASKSVTEASSQGLKRSDSRPRLSRPTTEAPFKKARESEEAVGLRLREDAYAIIICDC